MKIAGVYKLEIGNVVIETFTGKKSLEFPAVLVASHGLFTWGADAHEAVRNAVILEDLAFMGWYKQALYLQISSV